MFVLRKLWLHSSNKEVNTAFTKYIIDFFTLTSQFHCCHQEGVGTKKAVWYSRVKHTIEVFCWNAWEGRSEYLPSTAIIIFFELKISHIYKFSSCFLLSDLVGKIHQVTADEEPVYWLILFFILLFFNCNDYKHYSSSRNA